MNSEKTPELKSKIRQIYIEDFIGLIREKTEEQIEFQNQIKELFRNWESELNKAGENRIEKTEATCRLHNSIREVASQEMCIQSQYYLEKDFPEFYKNLLSYLNSLQLEQTVDQAEHNYRCTDKSKKLRCFLTSIKRIIFNLHVRITKFGNRLRKIIKKEPKEIPIWKRYVPFRRMANYYFGQKLISELIEPVVEFSDLRKNGLFSIYSVLRKIDEGFLENFTSVENAQFTVAQYLDEIELCESKILEFTNNLDARFDEIFEPVFTDFERDTKIVGTLELPASKFSYSNLEKFEDTLINKYKSKLKPITNFGRAIFEICTLYTEIALITYTVFGKYHSKTESLLANVEKIIKPNFDKIIEVLSNLLVEIKKNKAAPDAIKELITQNKERMDRELGENLIIRLVQILPYENVGITVEYLSDEIKHNISQLPESSIIVSKNDLDEYIKDNDFHEINLREIVEFDAYSKFLIDFKKIKSENDLRIKKFSTSILEIGQIASYNLETALSMFDSDEDKSDEKGAQIAIEGLDRAISKTEDIFEEYQSFIDEKLNVVKEGLMSFTANTRKLNNLDQLFTLKINISKAKTTEEIKQRMYKAVNSVKTFLPVVYDRSKKYLSTVTGKVEEISTKVGLSSKVSDISIEISEYLIETHNIISNLPLVYQRLFKNEPLKDDRFFIGREKELAEIEKAYNFWLKERFTAVAVIGEEGAGASSIINFAHKFFDPSFKVYRTELNQSYYEEAKILKKICELLEINKQLNDFQELIDLINNSDEKKIVIIENLEEFFLKIVDGFYTLRKVFELISRTNKKIFWIMTCNLYAWNYLLKVIDIDDYFAFNIILGKLRDEELETLILKRHSVSGYNLLFTPTSEEEKTKSVQKMEDTEKQEYLKTKFFERLNQNSNSNIALALLLWLRAIKSVSEETIEISMPAQLDYSFLKNMRQQKFFSLAAIIIHDGITIEEHSLIFDMSFEESKLILYSMEDDGILNKINESFKINFLLYRQVIGLLESKNILH